MDKENLPFPCNSKPSASDYITSALVLVTYSAQTRVANKQTCPNTDLSLWKRPHDRCHHIPHVTNTEGDWNYWHLSRKLDFIDLSVPFVINTL